MVRCLLVDIGVPPKLWGELMLTAAYFCNRMPHSGLDMETPFKRLYGKEASFLYLKIIGARAFVHINDAKKLEPKSWEVILCGFSEDEAISYRVWNPNTCRVVESKNVTFIETLPHIFPQFTRLSLLRELPLAELVDDYASTDNLLRDVRDYTAVLALNVNIPTEHANADSVDGGPRMEPILEQIRDVTRKDLLIPPGESSSGGASSVETLPGGTLPETSSPSSPTDPIPAGDQVALAPSPAPSPGLSKAAARRTPRPAPRSEPALTRALKASVPPRRQTRSGTASLAALFEQRTLPNLRSLALYTHVQMMGHCLPPRECVDFCRVRLRLHRLCRKPFGGGDKLKVPNTFKKAMSLPQGAQWKAVVGKEIASLKKHGVYELVPASSVPSGKKVVGSRWVNKIKPDDLCKSRLVVLGWAQVPGIDCGGTFAPVCRL